MPRGYMTTPEERDRMAALRATGMTVEAVARAVSRSEHTVIRYTGAATPPMRISDEEGRSLRALYEGPDKPSLVDLEREWGWSAQAIRDAILRAGGTLRPIGRKRRFPLSDAEALAWLEGGMTRQQIADHTGFKVGTVDSALSRARAARRRMAL